MTMVRRRVIAPNPPEPISPPYSPVAMDVAAEPLIPSVNALNTPYGTSHHEMKETATNDTIMEKKSLWLIYAIASGACAAFNGAFAKLYDIST